MFFFFSRLQFAEGTLSLAPFHFFSLVFKDAFVAQLVEQLTLNQLVRSSNLREGTIFSSSVVCGAAA